MARVHNSSTIVHRSQSDAIFVSDQHFPESEHSLVSESYEEFEEENINATIRFAQSLLALGDNSDPGQVLEAIQSLETAEMIKESSILIRHLRALLLFRLANQNPRLEITIQIPVQTGACCCTSMKMVPRTVQDTAGMARAKDERLSASKKLFEAAFKLAGRRSDQELSPTIKSKLAFSCAIMCNLFKNEPQTRYYVNQATKWDDINIDAGSAKCMLDKPTFYTLVSMTSHTQMHSAVTAIANSHASASVRY